MIRNKTFVTIIALGLVAAEAKNLIVQDQRNNFGLGLKISSQKMKCFDINEYNENHLNATDYLHSRNSISQKNQLLQSQWNLYIV